MPKFKFDNIAAYNKLVGKKVLLFIKENYSLTEVKIIEITQHRIRVSPPHSGTVTGVRKEDIMLLPINIKQEILKNLIKTAIIGKENLQIFLNTNAIQLTK